jgi:hypothetical protein
LALCVDEPAASTHAKVKQINKTHFGSARVKGFVNERPWVS